MTNTLTLFAMLVSVFVQNDHEHMTMSAFTRARRLATAISNITDQSVEDLIDAAIDASLCLDE